MSLYKTQYLRTRVWFILGCVVLFIVYFILANIIVTFKTYSTNASGHVDMYAPLLIFVMQIPYLVIVLALGLTGCGTTRGWRNTDLSMPVGKASYARENLGYALRLYLIGLIPIVLALVAFWYIGLVKGYHWIGLNPHDFQTMLYRAVIVEIIVGITCSLFLFGIMAPSLATGYYRGSWGWWAFIILYLPLFIFLPSLVVKPIVYLGGPIYYWLLFIAFGIVVAVWGWFNTIWYFKQKPDF